MILFLENKLPPEGFLPRVAVRSILKGFIHGHGFQILHRIAVCEKVSENTTFSDTCKLLGIIPTQWFPGVWK